MNFFFFSFLTCVYEQSDIELFGDIFDRIGFDGTEHDVRYRAQVWWTCDHGLWVANSGDVDANRGSING